ncbi:16S rRNA (cytidine(1402)-2'-O)-methyltransferase [Candidatus Giovannonibacteria bacterium RIFCSPHIGHO2_02_43_13]|uniref:Ribosomal RNA small subunit methyltransferase I n=1 Tax=Candidatus Giovannonibacteria bacterium RIFCSPHIGHO2_02_43_13 TaxID=1798330 RepID=A0A1F5WSM2_9BACT|nr:MAG: Ribosomal RNA small subunit methyltransferase I [Parcubacteria group bacterium GW2011_GWA2_44_13]OGF71651.1 MAG: 16S rRNA (cytidine(1402)-2'-O)-methyltransferase [Candidatus Giovannonibacteria bacterium RIFCSPHIGHO2_12_FULL_44_42]OGF78321.1 MAG: 16S rRNA (cytidine(1402)-2'-O)-methyltransferase [Candidatus Giovannonibacteria bacterium RIFCSPHIGHO2_02_43_13]OGF89526.1 MAG: 16S rRNA (cytidine(1402)-2'-O)-methyltransferase [Candidatus Giovannonibacteria bacterium RIFCSPLOWO2_02_FULL_43_54]O
MSKLYIVATPIGNLGDITLRAIETLKSVDFVLAEDTRVTKKLLSHFGIFKPLISFQEHSSPKILEKILQLLEEDKDLALVTDAGTPGVSDPGQRLIQAISLHDRQAGHKPYVAEIITIPGPSSLAAMISLSDIDLSKFTFLGFPPHKKGREKFFTNLAASRNPIIIFESPHRILKTLSQLRKFCGDRRANIGRELTKTYEEVFRGTLSEAEKYFTGEKQRGEFVIVINI